MDIIKKAAAVVHDESECEKVRSDYFQATCYRRYALEKKDESICEKARSDYSRSICYYEVATATRDRAICEKIPESDNKDAKTKEDCLGNIR